MKPPLFSYHDPRSTADVVGLLTSLDNAKLLAGGQSLMPMLNMRFVLPDHVIDLNRVDGLSHIRERDGALDLRFAVDLEERKAQQTRDNAHEHSADEKRPDHGGQLVSVSGRESREGGDRRERTRARTSR